MKIKVLFLTVLILFGILIFSDNSNSDLLINKWDINQNENSTKANGDSLNCTLVGTFDTGGDSWDIYVVDTFAFVADGDGGLRIINVSNPAILVETGYFNAGGNAVGVFVIDSFAYLADGNAGLRIINISNPAVPVETGIYNTGGQAGNVYVIKSFLGAMIDNFNDSLREGK